jgi:hypothetical protein
VGARVAGQLELELAPALQLPARGRQRAGQEARIWNRQ